MNDELRTQLRYIRRALGWLARSVVALLLLAVLAVCGVEAWRYLALHSSAKRFDASLAQVDDQLLQGRTPAEFYQDQIQGSNGWENLAALAAFEAHYSFSSRAHRNATPLTPEQISAIESLAEYHQHSRRGRTAYHSEEMLAGWLEATQALGDGFRQAATCDFIARTVDGDVKNPYFEDSTGLGYANPVQEGSLGRVIALFELGMAAEAEAELVSMAAVWTKWRHPRSASELLRVGHRLDDTLRLALALLQEKRLSQAAALRIATLEYHPLAVARRTAEAWLLMPYEFNDLFRRMGHPHDLFGWLIPGLHEDDASWRERISARARSLDDSSVMNERWMAILQAIEEPPPWDVPEPESFFRTSDSLSMNFLDDVYWLQRHAHGLISLELEVLRQQNGKLQKQAAQAAIAKHEYVTLRWEEETPILGLRALTRNAEAGPEYETRFSSR